MQTIWSGEWRLPAQPALFKLERKWPYIQHASKLTLPHCLSVSLLPSTFLFSHTHRHTNLYVFQKLERDCARTRRYTHPRRSNDGHWLESVFVIFILCFFTSPSPGPSPLLSLLLLLQSGRLGVHGRARIKELWGEKRAKKERLKNERQSRREERRSEFSLSTRPWLNHTLLCWDLPRNKKWETQREKKMWKGNNGVSWVTRRWRRKGEKKKNWSVLERKDFD